MPVQLGAAVAGRRRKARVRCTHLSPVDEDDLKLLSRRPRLPRLLLILPLSLLLFGQRADLPGQQSLPRAELDQAQSPAALPALQHTRGIDWLRLRLWVRVECACTST